MTDTLNKYTSPEYFEREMKTLYRNSWICAGFGHQCPDPGNVAPVDVAGMPLLMVRQKDGSIFVFHNVCRHRGAKLFTEACDARTRIRCPYHSWIYRLDGALAQRPHFDGPNQHTQDGDGLWKVDSAMWGDIVFVNISGTAEPFEDFIAPVERIGQKFGVGEAQFDETVSIEIPANWKLLVENFVDGYHIASVHPQLEKSVPTRLHSFYQDGACFVGTAPRQRHAAGSGGGSYVSGLPDFSDVADDHVDTLTYMSCYPNLCINMVSDRLSIYLMRPIAPNLTEEIICNYYAPGAFTDDTEDLRRQMTRNQLAFNAEDIAILLQLQDGRASDIYDDGAPSPYWDANAEGFLAMCAKHTLPVPSGPER